jgi:hypothetical protein
MCLGWLNLVELFEQLAGIELPIVFHPEALNGSVGSPSVLARPKILASSPVQSMVFFWILIVSDSSAEIT